MDGKGASTLSDPVYAIPTAHALQIAEGMIAHGFEIRHSSLPYTYAPQVHTYPHAPEVGGNTNVPVKLTHKIV